MRCFIAFATLISLVTPSIGDDNWPQFRGPTGDGFASSKNLPTSWSERENIVWKTPIHDKGWSSPVIWGDQIWLTTAHEEFSTPKETTKKKESRPSRVDFYAICLDRISGKIIHDVKVLSEENPAFCIDFNSYATPTPVIEKDKVYVHFGSHGTVCLDTKTAEILWSRKDLLCNHFRGPGSSPILFQDYLILTFDGYDKQYLTALDKMSGKTAWTKNRELPYASNNGDNHKAYSTPSILMLNEKPQLISPAADYTVAYNPMNGEEIWRVQHGGMNEAAKPIFGNGLIYLNNGSGSTLLAVKQGGKGILSKDEVAWKMNKGVPSRPSMLLIQDTIYMVSDSGFVSSVDAKTGAQLWSDRFSSSFSASPIVANGIIYFADQDGKTHLVASGSTPKIIAANKLDDGCMASPAVSKDAIFLRTKKNLYCIQSSNDKK